MAEIYRKLDQDSLVTVIKTVWYRHKERHIYQHNKTESPKINPYIYQQLIFTKIIQWGEKKIFQKMVLEQVEYPHAKE